jgi:hypothetical protein
METSRTTLRMPAELAARVRALADAQRRSVNAELLILIELGCNQEEREVADRGTPVKR